MFLYIIIEKNIYENGNMKTKSDTRQSLNVKVKIIECVTQVTLMKLP